MLPHSTHQALLCINERLDPYEGSGAWDGAPGAMHSRAAGSAGPRRAAAARDTALHEACMRSAQTVAQKEPSFWALQAAPPASDRASAAALPCRAPKS